MAINIRIFSDFTCPFCFIGAGIIKELKHEFDMEEEWVSYELHPETPEKGILLADRFPDYDLDALFEELRIKGARYGCEFGDVTLLSNSRLALEAGEFARDRGKHSVFHTAVFRAYFSEARDIGEIAVLLDIAARVGLDTDELLKALSERHYEERLKAGHEEGKLYNVSVLPTFVFEKKERIVGMRPIEAFRRVLTGLSQNAPDGMVEMVW
jgi:predicted DsbA family dithiol-disulfide isomerase